MSEAPLTLVQPKVIDPDDKSEMERFARLSEVAWKRVRDRHPDRVGTPTWEIVAEQFRLFRDPTYFARPDEPLGLGAVVEDETGNLWTSVTIRGASDRWQPNALRSDSERRPYEGIAVVRVLSVGVTP